MKYLVFAILVSCDVAGADIHDNQIILLADECSFLGLPPPTSCADNSELPTPGLLDFLDDLYHLTDEGRALLDQVDGEEVVP